MKKCPGCESLNSDDEIACGICGRDLSQALTISLANEASAKTPAVKPSLRVNAGALTGLLLGLGLVGTGFYFLFGFANLTATRFALAIVIIPIGIMVTLAVYDVTTGQPYRPMGGRRGYRAYRAIYWPQGKRGGWALEQEAETEEEEQRKRVTGEAD